jgi:predicted nucleic acid-binding Zn ribbon protein
MTDKEEVRDIKGTMRELLEEEGIPELSSLLRIRESWGKIVGEEVAGITRPYRLEAGKLYVGVGSHARVQDMLFQTEHIKRRIKEEMGMEIGGVIVRKIKMK